jgi:hypothetical protein
MVFFQGIRTSLMQKTPIQLINVVIGDTCTIGVEENIDLVGNFLRRKFFSQDGLQPIKRYPEWTMQIIIKIIAFFVSLFVIANGIWIVAMPPFGDEPQGYVIIAAGLFILIITHYFAQFEDKREA